MRLREEDLAREAVRRAAAAAGNSATEAEAAATPTGGAAEPGARWARFCHDEPAARPEVSGLLHPAAELTDEAEGFATTFDCMAKLGRGARRAAKGWATREPKRARAAGARQREPLAEQRQQPDQAASCGAGAATCGAGAAAPAAGSVVRWARFANGSGGAPAAPPTTLALKENQPPPDSQRWPGQAAVSCGVGHVSSTRWAHYAGGGRGAPGKAVPVPLHAPAMPEELAAPVAPGVPAPEPAPPTAAGGGGGRWARFMMN